MPDERREFHKIRPASHTLLSVNYLYQMNMEKRKGGVYEVEAGSRPALRRKLSFAPQCDKLRHYVVAIRSQAPAGVHVSDPAVLHP